MMGVAGLGNSAMAIWSWYKYLTDYQNPTLFWYSWFIACVTSGLLWVPLTIYWPATSFSSSTVVLVFQVLSQGTLVGAYALYWIALGHMAYTFFVVPDSSGSVYGS